MFLNEKIEKINNYLSKKPVERAFLFGSYARSEQNNNSDIDILLEFEKTAKIGLFQFSRIKLDLENLLSISVDLLTDEAISTYIKPFILKDLIKIYEKSN